MPDRALCCYIYTGGDSDQESPGWCDAVTVCVCVCVYVCVCIDTEKDRQSQALLPLTQRILSV